MLAGVSWESLWIGLRNTSPAEWAATAAGVVYILLIIRRNRWGWVAGGLSSSIFAVLFARADLPMQAVLQASYVAGAVYGWWSWAPDAGQQRISSWTLRGNLLAIAACIVISLGLKQLLMDESAFPFIDSLVACAGLFTTWLVARVYLENWLYWIVIDVVSIYLCLAQGLIATAMLFVIYTVIATMGLHSWWKLRRSQPAA